MAQIVRYHSGGFAPAALQQNRAELYDSMTATYTRWSTSGAQLEQRALTPSETALLAAQDATSLAETNGSTLRGKAQAALTANATYLALATPSNAQNAAQVRALTREVNGLIRLLLGSLDDVSGT